MASHEDPFIVSARDFNELEDYDTIGDHQLTVGIPIDTPFELRLYIMAAIKAYFVGLRSMDYVLKKYGHIWSDKLQASENNEEELREVIALVRKNLDDIVAKLKAMDKLDHVGLIVARGAMVRLHNTFRSLLILIRKGLYYEALAMARLILEQIAWAYAIHNLDEQKILKTSPSKTISILKNFYPFAGQLYGFLSEHAHISPNTVGQYLTIREAESSILFQSSVQIKVAGYVSLILLDIYASSFEYIFNRFIDDLQFIISNRNGELVVNEERSFKIKVLNKYKGLLLGTMESQ